jgi:hypothetical protein
MMMGKYYGRGSRSLNRAIFMNSRTITPLAFVALIMTCAIICGCVAPDEQSIAVNTTVPVERGWDQAAVALLELYTLEGVGQEPYDRFNGSVVSPEPAILLDSSGQPLYYRFYVQKNGEIYYAVQVSANKLLGTTVTEIGDFGYIGRNESVNMAVNGSDPDGAESRSAYGTPVPPYNDEYTQLMLDSWEVKDAYAQSVLRDAENAGIDLSTPLSYVDHEIIGEILWEHIRQREQRIKEIEEKYQVNIL